MSDFIHTNLLEEPQESNKHSDNLPMMNDQLLSNSSIDINKGIMGNQVNNPSINHNPSSAPPLPVKEHMDMKEMVMLEDKLIDMGGKDSKGENVTVSVLSNPFADNSNHALDNSKNSSSISINITNDDDIRRNTLNEPIYDTIKRDVIRIGRKLYFVLNPLTAVEERPKQLLQWDLWGPLLFTIFLASTLAMNSTEMGGIFILIFFLVWAGGFLVYLNADLLGAKLSFFHIVCLLGYCLVPLNIISFIFALTHFYEIVRVFLILFACAWSSYSAIGFLHNACNEDRQGLVLYPAILLYLFLGGVILMTR